jgi:hypothetical protein
MLVPAASPPRQRQPKVSILTREATGLLVIAIVILIITLARYWYRIPWSAR